MIAFRKLAFVGIASVSLAACGDFETVPLVQPGTQTGQVVFENPTTHPISSLQFNPCNTRVFGEPDFGDDRIDSSIPPGQSRQFTVSAGCYNLRAMTGGRGMFSMNNIEDFQVFSVQPGGTTTVRVRRQPLF